MLCPVIVLARKLCSRRLTLKMTQRQVARAVGCSQAYVAHLESGLRPCSRRVGLLLERLYRVRQGSYSKLGLRRGRPGLKPGARLVLREVREAREVSSPRELAPLPRGPRFPRAQRLRPLGDPLWPIALHLGLEAAEEVRLLERRRRGQVGFWRLLNSLRFDSWSEKRLNVKVGLECEQLLELAPGKVGCEMRCVDGMTGRDAHHRATAAFVLRQGETSVVWFPQLCVRTDRGYRWPDCTLVVAWWPHPDSQATVVPARNGNPARLATANTSRAKSPTAIGDPFEVGRSPPTPATDLQNGLFIVAINATRTC